MKKKVVFICTHNSARSQIAEGLCNHYFSDKWEAFSAGTEKTLVKPLAIKAMLAKGIDISHHQSKTLDSFKNETFDLVITVCDNAKEACPYCPGKNVIHKSFVDPSNAEGTEEDKLHAFIKTTDEIYDWMCSSGLF